MGPPFDADQPSPRIDRAARILRGAAMFRGADPAWVTRLASAAWFRTVERGGEVFRQGEAPSAISLIISGVVKVVRTEGPGEPNLLALFGPHEVPGLVAVLRGVPFPGSAVPVTAAAEVLRIDAAPVRERMARDAELSMAVHAAALAATTRLQDKVAVMGSGEVSARLGRLLLQLAERFGDELEDGTVVVPLALSRGELACLVGARTETVIRALSAWQREGVVESREGAFTLLRPAALRAPA